MQSEVFDATVSVAEEEMEEGQHSGSSKVGLQMIETFDKLIRQLEIGNT